MRPFTTCLWFDTEAEQAADFYCGIFPNSRVVGTTAYPSGDRAGTAMTVDLELNGNPFVLLNGGPEFRFTEAISFQIPCADQAEIDHYWDRLTDGGEESWCGWLKDRFGVSWQVVPERMGELFGDPESAPRVAEAMAPMHKLVIADLEAAAGSVAR